MGTHKSKPKIQKFNLYKTIFLYAKAKICKFCKSNPHPSHPSYLQFFVLYPAKEFYICIYIHSRRQKQARPGKKRAGRRPALSPDAPLLNSVQSYWQPRYWSWYHSPWQFSRSPQWRSAADRWFYTLLQPFSSFSWGQTAYASPHRKYSNAPYMFIIH